MTLTDEIQQAYEIARQDLLDERVSAGHWIGELSTSALSTATAVSALCLVRRQSGAALDSPGDASLISRLIDNGIQWLVDHQNQDGGWGDTQKSYSNISTSMLAVAALHLAKAAPPASEILSRAETYIRRQGEFAGLRQRYGRDKTFAVPILTNYALAGLAPWSEVAALPFELACLPQSFYRFARMPVVSYAIPALVAVGQVGFHHRPPRLAPWRWLRSAAIEPSLRVLRRMQPTSGGYLEAVPLTSFVVMSLAGCGRAAHEVARSGVQFIIDSVRPDGSWPIDSNLATWNTSLAINALASAGEDVAALACWDWLLSCQQKDRHPFTGAAPGGWGWTDLSGAVPDADDTPAALLALAAWRDAPSFSKEDHPRLISAVESGVYWLLDLQNSDGGWPTFCRGWGKLPFDRSGDDLTAHALRALAAWREDGFDQARITRAVERGFRYLQRRQHAQGSWAPLWFGNQDRPREENPEYGTAKVLMAYRDLSRWSDPAVSPAVSWLLAAQNEDGGWGGGPKWREFSRESRLSSVEETALAVEALLHHRRDHSSQRAINKGLQWICRAVADGSYRQDSPIGFYFAKLWYHEKLYPLTFTVSVLGRALRWRSVRSHPTAASATIRPT